MRIIMIITLLFHFLIHGAISNSEFNFGEAGFDFGTRPPKLPIRSGDFTLHSSITLFGTFSGGSPIRGKHWGKFTLQGANG